MRVVFLESGLGNYRVPFLTELLGHVDVGIVATTFAPGTREALEGVGVTCMQLSSFSIERTWKHPQGFSEKNPANVLRGTRRALAQLQPDVIIAGDLSTRVLQALVFARLCRATRRPKVISWARLSEHSERGRGRVQKYLRPRLLGATDGVITNGRSGTRYIEGLGVDARKIHQIPQATDPRVVGITSGIQHCPVRLLYVGRLVELKGLELLFQEMTKNPGVEVMLKVVGVGPCLTALKQQALRLGLDVEFVGYRAGRELAAQYSGADYLVFPSLSDEWGLVVNEALASGLPVLGSVYSQAVIELIQDGANGWRFQPDHAGELAGLLASLPGVDEEVRNQMRTNALATGKLTSPIRIADLFAEMFDGLRK
jgi:glycosyltransferase involved in cell wall biosynthesis